MKKNELYIKKLLSEKFKGVGNFQRFEYCMHIGSTRPDFVILDDQDFTYFEIKGETDDFCKFEGQTVGSIGFFTKRFLVVCKKHERLARSNIKYAWETHRVRWGLILVEDLEQDNFAHKIEYKSRELDPRIFPKMLWREEKAHILQSVQTRLRTKVRYYCTRKKEWKPISRMGSYEMDEIFHEYCSGMDLIRVLNKVFANRNFDYFKDREENRLM